MKKRLYNIKMRSSKGGNHENGGKHISGAEKIISQDKLIDSLNELVTRAQNHSKGKADFINISMEEVKEESITYLTSLPIKTIEVDNYIEGRKGLLNCLKTIGIDNDKSKKILKMLENFPLLRGAILLDINNLHRLEPNLNRGVRATGMDWDEEILPSLNKTLSKEGINNCHVKEALVLATKVSKAPGVIGEICWSDDPDYTAGYIASEKIGYIRFSHLKPNGIDKGGRIFLFDSKLASLKDCIYWLEQQLTLINQFEPYKGTFTLSQCFEGDIFGTNNY